MTREELNALINALLFLRTSATDETALASKEAYPTWKLQQYAVGDRVRYGDLLYKCLQAHTAQSDWTPDVAVSLWVRVDDPSIEFPEWRQPTGAQDAYAKGAKVSHNEKHWVSDVDNNVWEPSVYGWSEV
jgi:hypothetical protein